MKKTSIFLLLLTLFYAKTVLAQKKVEPTTQFTISGLVEKPKTITYEDLEKLNIVSIGDLKITNHTGEFRKEYKNLKGVSLLDVFNDVKITADIPKLLSEYYLVLTASDAYSVVISWNELFNTEIGNSFFLVTEANNESLKNASEKILLIATKDFKTGRRHIKGLQSIEVRRI